MKFQRRLDALEGKFIAEPTVLLMQDGSTVAINGHGDYLLELLGVSTGNKPISAEQARQLDLIRHCKSSKEPGGAHMVELIRCFLLGPVEETHESRETV